MRMIEYYFMPTKQCNLRCLYCREKENYKKRQRFDLATMKGLFSKILRYQRRLGLSCGVDFCYSGGEILTMGKKWLVGVLELQKMMFGAAGIKYQTRIQTNLTLLDQEWIELLKKHRIMIGTSLDLFAETRPFKGKKEDSANMVIDQLIKLIKNKVGVTVIIVITRQNFKKGKEIFKVMNKAGLSFHTLALEPSSLKYCPELAISPEEYAQCLIEMMAEYLNSKKQISIANLDGYLGLVKHGYPARDGLCANMRNCPSEGDRFFFENTGETYYCGCFCEPEVLLGNIFRDSLRKMVYRLENKTVFKKLKNRYALIRQNCQGCEFLSICNGGCPSFAYQEGNMFSKSKFLCRVNKKVFSYLKNRLK